jgi:hypothetical protein
MLSVCCTIAVQQCHVCRSVVVAALVTDHAAAMGGRLVHTTTEGHKSDHQRIQVECVRAHTTNCYSLTRAQQQTDPADEIVGSLDDLRAFSVFIFMKQAELSANKSGKQQRDTQVDAIFKMSLREFHTELISYEATLKVG